MALTTHSPHTPHTPHASVPRDTAAPGVVSRHGTSAGTVVWTRCVCGRLRMVYAPDPLTPERPLTAGGSTAGCPGCG